MRIHQKQPNKGIDGDKPKYPRNHLPNSAKNGMHIFSFRAFLLGSSLSVHRSKSVWRFYRYRRRCRDPLGAAKAWEEAVATACWRRSAEWSQGLLLPPPTLLLLLLTLLLQDPPTSPIPLISFHSPLLLLLHPFLHIILLPSLPLLLRPPLPPLALLLPLHLSAMSLNGCLWMGVLRMNCHVGFVMILSLALCLLRMKCEMLSSICNSKRFYYVILHSLVHGFCCIIFICLRGSISLFFFFHFYLIFLFMFQKHRRHSNFKMGKVNCW